MSKQIPRVLKPTTPLLLLSPAAVVVRRWVEARQGLKELADPRRHLRRLPRNMQGAAWVDGTFFAYRFA